MANKPIAEKGQTCPFHRRDVSKVCHTCPLYIEVRGKHPITEEDVDGYGCSFTFLPMLLHETAKQSYSAAAATENARNEIVGALRGTAQVMIALNQGDDIKLIDG